MTQLAVSRKRLTKWNQRPTSWFACLPWPCSSLARERGTLLKCCSRKALWNSGKTESAVGVPYFTRLSRNSDNFAKSLCRSGQRPDSAKFSESRFQIYLSMKTLTKPGGEGFEPVRKLQNCTASNPQKQTKIPSTANWSLWSAIRREPKKCSGCSGCSG
jgi:hypothetical protein